MSLANLALRMWRTLTRPFQEYFIYAGTYVDTAIVTRANVRVYGQTLTPNSYAGNSACQTLSGMPARVHWTLTLVQRGKL